MIYIGIDPGKDGALAIIAETMKKPYVLAFDQYAYNVVLRDRVGFSRQPFGAETVCCLERVGAMPKQGVASTFRFGENYGFIQGLLTAHKIPYQLVTPQAWKREFGVTADKNTSIAVCKRLFPNVNLRRTERCQKDHDGKAEALLLAEYARRHMGYGGANHGKE